MKIVFAHDHRFLKRDNVVYSSGGLPASAWNRYLDVFDSVEVVARAGETLAEDDLDSYAKSSREGVNFHLIGSLSDVWAYLGFRRHGLQELTEVIQSSDALIARLPSEIGFQSVAIAEKLNVPWAIEVVECPWDALWNYGSFKAKVFAPMQWFRMRRVAKRSKYSIYVTERFLQERYPSPGASLACSNVMLNSFVDESSLKNRLIRLDSLHGRIRVGLIGSLKGKFKGIQTAIEALSILRSRSVDVELRILGAGNFDQWAVLAQAQGVGEYVFFDGVRSSGEPVFEWLDDIDIYIQPSLKEGLPRALIEAMSRGCPCLATNVAGIPELLPSSRLVNPGNAAELADKLYSWVSKPALMKEAVLEDYARSKNYSYEKLSVLRHQFLMRFKSSIL